MEALPYELGPIRPVDEADSLLIRTTRGCPWNKCEFCVNYRSMRFSKRPVEDIKKVVLEKSIAKSGESIIITAGLPFKDRRKTNMLRIEEI